MVKTAAEYQAIRRAKVKATGDMFLHVQISPRAKGHLVALGKGLNLTHRQIIELLLDTAHKELSK